MMGVYFRGPNVVAAGWGNDVAEIRLRRQLIHKEASGPLLTPGRGVVGAIGAGMIIV